MFFRIFVISSLVVTNLSIPNITSCPPLSKRQGFRLVCEHLNSFTNCSTPSPINTTAYYGCDEYHRSLRPESVVYQLKCNHKGKWSNLREYDEYLCVLDCGKSFQSRTDFIALGQETRGYTWPWHATIFIQIKNTFHYICGGSLITNRVVLTAAHCVITRKQIPIESYYVVLGASSSNWTVNTLLEQIQIFKVKNAAVPEEFHLDTGEYRYDIALIELNKTVIFTSFVSPVCFPFDGDNNKPMDPIVVGIGEVVGFGSNEHGVHQKYLRYARIPVLSSKECKNSSGFVPGIGQYCAGGLNGTTVCTGDSGGGMVFKNPGGSRYYVQGIVSNGASRRRSLLCNGPAIFTSVIHFSRWVSEKLQQLDKARRQPDEVRDTPIHFTTMTETEEVSCDRSVLSSQGCTLHCKSNQECTPGSACIDFKCQDPCASCGPNSSCEVINHLAICRCSENFTGDSNTWCIAECSTHADCPSNRACDGNKCVDPCVSACGLNALCIVEPTSHKAICKCPNGYSGHPLESCRRNHKQAFELRGHRQQ